MRGAVVSGVVAFVAVLTLGIALRPPGPEPTSTPTIAGPLIQCLGMPDADCQKLAVEIIAKAEAAYPGKTVAVVTVTGSGYEVRFTDGTAFGSGSSR